MKKQSILFFSILLLTLALFGCSTNEQTKKSHSKKNVELTVSAAASLQDALNDIKKSFQKEHPTIMVNFNFGASGALQQQILQGAPVDLFFSAAEDKFQKLVQDGLIVKKTNLVGNELVLVVPKDTDRRIDGFQDLTKVVKLALGTPESVPAGQYGKETLNKMNVWTAVEGKVVYAKDVRQVLTYVETNNVDAGIVYKTDALTSKKVKIVSTAKEDSHDPITYPVGVIQKSTHLKEAQLFYQYLQSKPSLEILKKYGFKDLSKK